MIRAGLLDQWRTDRALETVERNANSQLQQVEDLLDVSRIVRGDLGLNFSQINFIEVFTAAIQVMQPAAEAKAIQLTTITTLANQAPIYLWGDADRLQQVILNLVSNAIKFTSTGGQVTVQLDLAWIEGHPFAQLRVQDTGIGINADFLPYVFERFRQADSTSARSHKGLGLGLAIVQYIVRQHGGTIQAESPGVGQGATFTVKISCLRSDRERQNIASSIPDSSVLPANTTVLTVDDEADVREWLTTLLQSYEAVVIAVESVAEALRILGERTPTILISDIALPYEDGYVLIQQLRRFEALHRESQGSPAGVQIPAIALSAYAGEESRQKALATGFQAYLAKPVTPNELIRTIVRLIENSGQ